MTTNPYQRDVHPGGPMSVEEYFQVEANVLDAKYEYIDGVARLMSGGSGEHDQIARNTANAIEQYFQSGPCFVRGSDMQVLLGIKANQKDYYVYPDATVSCDVADRRRGNKIIRSPRIVVEVLSPSTEPLDRGKKLQAYKACATIQEIVLVSQFARHVEVHRRGEDGWTYALYDADAPTIDLPSIDVQITMDEIYRGIDFNEPLMDE